MASPPDISLVLYFEDIAAAHKEKGSTFRLAWHNVFVVNQLALVSRQWHTLVYRYRHCVVVTAMYALSRFAACFEYQLVSLAARRRQMLPKELRYPAYIDEVFDNLCAIVKKMLEWKACNLICADRRASTSKFSFEIRHGQFGPMRLRVSWSSPSWPRHVYGLPKQQSFSAFDVPPVCRWSGTR